MKALVFIQESNGREFYPKGLTEAQAIETYTLFLSGEAIYETEDGHHLRLELRDVH